MSGKHVMWLGIVGVALFCAGGPFRGELLAAGLFDNSPLPVVVSTYGTVAEVSAEVGLKSPKEDGGVGGGGERGDAIDRQTDYDARTNEEASAAATARVEVAQTGSFAELTRTSRASVLQQGDLVEASASLTFDSDSRLGPSESGSATGLARAVCEGEIVIGATPLVPAGQPAQLILQVSPTPSAPFEVYGWWVWVEFDPEEPPWEFDLWSGGSGEHALDVIAGQTCRVRFALEGYGEIVQITDVPSWQSEADMSVTFAARGQAIPEPATLVLLASAALVLLWRAQSTRA